MTQTLTEPLAMAAALAREFQADAAERDLAAGTPRAQRDRIRASGLLHLSIPTEHGGPGATWPTILRVVREIATADASLAHLFGYHHLGLVTPNLIGTPAQRARWYTATLRDNLFWGNSLNPLDPRTTLTPSTDGQYRLNGAKSFCTGAADSDLLLVSATLPDNPQLQVAVLPTHRDGVQVQDDWNNMGQRQTDSGSVTFHDVLVEESDLLGPPGVGGSALATLRTCVTQAILSNVFLGVAQGAFDEARQYTRDLERPFAGSSARPADDAYILHDYGDMWVSMESARLLLDVAADALQSAWSRQEQLTAEERGQCAVAIATAKVASARCALDLTSRMFEVMGARATSARYRFDRFWRNVRTLSLHDPVDQKVREVGDYVLNTRLPNPSFYS